MTRRSVTLALALVLAAATTVGCSSEDGRALPPPDPSTTTVPPTLGPAEEVGVFTLTSPDFADGGVIPMSHTCDGDGTSPPLTWTATPPAADLALVVTDIDAADLVHWVVTGIDPVVVGLGAGGVPEGAVEHTNGQGELGWLPPCPPEGAGPHRYAFTLHALAEPMLLDPVLTATEAAELIRTSSIAQASLTGTYERAG